MSLDTQIITASGPLVIDPRFNWQNFPVKIVSKGKGGDTENSSGTTAVAGAGGGGVNVWNAVTLTDPSLCSVLINTLTSSFFDEAGREYGAHAGSSGLNGGTGGFGGGGYPDVEPDVSHTGGNGGNPQSIGVNRGGGGGGEAATETSDGNPGSNGSGLTGGAGGTGTDGADGGNGGNHNTDGNPGTGDGAGAGGPGRGSKLGKSGGAGKVEITGTLWEAVTSDAGDDQAIESDETVQLAGVADGDFESVLWSNGSGDGTFDDAAALDAIYTPGAADIAAGTVTLTLTVTPDGDNYYSAAADDEMVVTITVAAGYEIYVNKDREWQAGDVPVGFVASSETTFETAVAGLGLLPNTVYFVSIVAVTANGRSEPVSARIVTDETGAPEIRPSPVGDLTVVATADGGAVARWTYDQVTGDRADSFAVEVTGLRGEAPIAVDDVPCNEAREYRAEFSGPDGDYRVKVYSQLAGVFEPAVTGVDVRLDGTAPVGDVPEMTAF